MAGKYIFFIVALSACAPADRIGQDRQAGQSLQGQSLQGQSLQGQSLQGQSLQGQSLQGQSLQGQSLQGHLLAGVTLAGDALDRVRVERGELVAEARGVTLRGADLIGARLLGETAEGERFEYRIADAVPEDPAHDPTGTGHTLLYSLEQWVEADQAWVPACISDYEGRRVAIPIGAIWNARGERVESETHFTFACTSGVIAKCYRWGYRPWLVRDRRRPERLAAVHQACTRLARADYCGTGRSHTVDGAWVNVFDALEPSIQRRDATGPTWLFEGGWNEDGAVCFSRERWRTLEPAARRACGDRLRAPDRRGQPPFCDRPEEVGDWDPQVVLFSDRPRDRRWEP